MPLRSIAFMVFFVGSSAASVINPMTGVICYLVLYHVYPQTTWWGKPLDFLGIRYSLICGACLFVGTVLNLNRLKFGRRFLHPVEAGMLLVLLAIIFSTATGTPWDADTELFLDKMVKVFVFGLLLSHVAVTKRDLWQLVVVLNLCALYLGHEARIAPRGAFEGNRLNGIGGPDFQESSGLAIHLGALLPFVLVLFRQRSLWWKGLAFLAAGYAANAMVLCRTRSAAFAAAVAGAFSLWYAPRRHRRWLAAMLCLGCCGVLFLGDKFFWDRMVTIWSSPEDRDPSAGTRLVIWSAAWEMIKSHPLGVGIGHFQSEIGNYAPDAGIGKRDAHNSYILCAAETGLPGLAAFVGTLGLAWWTLGRLGRRVRENLPDPERFELILFANRMSLLVYAVAGFFSSRFYTEGQWILVATTVCSSRAIENESRLLTSESVVEELPLAWQGGLEVSTA
jgi:putative inorganic carbon (HCO3(-)) transporter